MARDSSYEDCTVKTARGHPDPVVLGLWGHSLTQMKGEMIWEMPHVAQLLPVQSLCADTLSESGVRKGSLIEKEPTKTTGP